MKDELGGQIMKEFVELRAKRYNYLKDKNDEGKMAKDTNRCVIRKKQWDLKIRSSSNWK